MNSYKALKDKHQKEVNDFPMFFAFSQQQFEEGIVKLGLGISEKYKLTSLGGGGFILKTDALTFQKMFIRHAEEMKNARTDDQFLLDMFDYELGNHEFGYTHEVEPALDALGLTIKEVNEDQRLLHALQNACKAQEEWYALNG